MSVERLAARAGTAMRTAIEGEVDVMTALREVEDRAGAQHRNARVGAIAAAAAVVALLIGGAAWSLLGKDNATIAPPAKPRPSATAAPAPAPASLPGSKMYVPLAVSAASGWATVIDDKALRFWPAGSRPETPQNIWFVEPTQVFDPATLAPIAAPADYVAWIRSHPWVKVVAEKDVTVAGRPGTEIDVKVIDLPSQDIVPDSAHKIFLNYAHDATAAVAIYGMNDQIRLTVVDLGARDLVIEGQGVTDSAAFSQAYSDFVDGVEIQ